jgi:hypothetical protein
MMPPVSGLGRDRAVIDEETGQLSNTPRPISLQSSASTDEPSPRTSKREASSDE